MNNYSIGAKLRSISITLLLFFAGVASVYSQVALAPSALFIQGRTGVGNLYVTNPSTSPQEVSIGFVFGYPTADSAGNLAMNYQDSVSAQTYGLNQFVKAYPRAFILQPKEQQTVRLQVRTSSTVKDAFLFTRIKVTSMERSPEIGKKQTDSVSAQINFKFEQILPIFYRIGNVSTGLSIHGVSTKINNNMLTVLADVERTGTAPFLGSVKAELFSSANEQVALAEATAAIYFRIMNKLDLDLSKAGKGQHRLVLTFETKRSDIAKEDLLQAPPVTKEVTVNVP